MLDAEFTAFFPFCGLGAGALGFTQAEVELLGRRARFRSLGGIDVDPLAAQDFEKLTKSPCLLADVGKLTAADLLAFCPNAPDCVFLSPPCKGFSGLLGTKAARAPKYRKLNRLVLQWTQVMLEAWRDNLPGLVLLENVPRIASRGRHLLRKVRKLLRRAGYVFSSQTHDCGELGGLAQHRNRFLLVARRPERVGPLLYQPPKLRVRACGEVLANLPMPNDPAGGPMHVMPRISWLNWVRLALIPAGGDWRDLPGVLDGLERRAVHKRHGVEDWAEPSGTVAGSGSNGVANVADPRVQPQASNPNAHWNKYAVGDWHEPASTVIGASRPGSGAPAIADPRAREYYRGTLGVQSFDAPAGTVTGAAAPSRGVFSVADPRAREHFKNVLRVVPWNRPIGTVTSGHGPTNGGGVVADPRLSTGYDHSYRVLRWDEASFTIHGKAHIGTGAYAVADARVPSEPRNGAYGVIAWDEAAKTVTGAGAIDNGPWAIADERFPDAPPLIVIENVRKPPSAVPVIIAADGTWHRPITTLELAALQSIPTEIDGKPLVLAGTSSTAWRERIGNAVPPKAAKRIAEQMLIALVEEAEGTMLLRGDGAVWVRPEAIAP